MISKIISLKQILTIFLALSVLVNPIKAKILICTYSYNRPDFIEIQYKTFKKFLKDDYEFIVFNDATDNNLYDEIVKTCAKCSINCIQIPQKIHSQPYLQRWPGEDYHHPAVRNCNVVMYSLNNYGFKHDDIVILLDSDMFLVKEFSIRDYMKNYHLAGAAQSRDPHIRYLWIGLLFFDMRTMPNKETIDFNCGKIDTVHVDAGGQSHFYLKNNPMVKTRYLNQLHPQTFACDDCRKNHTNNPCACSHNTTLLKQHLFDKEWIDFIQSGPYNMEFYLDNSFLHYRAGSNWERRPQEYIDKKTKNLNNFIDNILSQA